MDRMGLIRLLLLSFLALPGCGSDGGSARDATDPGDLPADVADDTGPDVPRVPVEVTEPFRVALGYLQRDRSSTELLLRDPAVPSADGTASLSGALAALDPSLDCSLGCRVDPTGRWLAVFVEAPVSGSGGSRVRLFRLSAGPVVTASDVPDVTDVRALAFGDDTLYWSRPRAACEAERGPSRGCHAYFRRPLSTPGTEEFLFAFPPASALDTALPHSGRFVLGEDRRTVLLLGPTVNTQSVWIWRTAGEPIRVAGPLCGTRQSAGQECIGSGTSYADTDPLALSPDGRHLVLATVLQDRDLVLAHVDLQGDPALRTAVLLGMPDEVTDFAKNACYNRFGGWEPTAVQAPLRFSPDGGEVVFVGRSTCVPNRDKAWTNLLALPLSRIDAGGRLQRGDLRWITDFPTGSVAACVSILPDALDLSPTGDFLVFVGTPRFGSDGQPIGDDQRAHLQDAEVWVTRRDGTTQPAQLTADLQFMATSVQAVPVLPAP